MEETWKGNKRIGNYFFEKELGRGEFAVVSLATNSTDNKKYAIKSINKQRIQDTEMYKKLLNTEILIMTRINHPNIIHLHDLFESTNNYYLVLDYCNKGDFQKFMLSRKLKFLEEREAVMFLKQIMNGFQELRKNKIIHRDFKLANLLVNDEIVKIGDFGFAKRGRDVAKTIVGTYMTMAPELLVSSGENEYTSKSDLWSLGVVFYQMLFGELPYFGLTPNEIYFDIKQKNGKFRYPHSVSAQSQDLIQKLLTINPKERIDWPEFFNHELFSLSFRPSLRDLALIEPQDEADDIQACDRDLNSVEEEFRKNRQKVVTATSKSPMRKNRDSSPSTSARISPTKHPEEPSAKESVSMKIECAKSDKEKDSINVNFGGEVRGRPINEEVIHSEDAENMAKLSAIKDVSKRYAHEKKKVLFIVFTVRHVRKLMKNTAFSDLAKDFYAISVMLLKKAITLTELNLASVINGHNVFQMPRFEDFLSSEYRLSVVESFRSEKPNLSKYFSYLLQTGQKESFSTFAMTLIPLVTNNIALIELDQHTLFHFNEIREKLEALSSELKHAIIATLVAIYYSIKCEEYLQFVRTQSMFDFDAFYSKHDKMSDTELLQICNA